MPTTYGNDIVYCLKSHCGVRGYCRQKWVLQVQIICKFSNERTCKRNKDVQGLSCGFEVYETVSLLPLSSYWLCLVFDEDLLFLFPVPAVGASEWPILQTAGNVTPSAYWIETGDVSI